MFGDEHTVRTSDLHRMLSRSRLPCYQPAAPPLKSSRERYGERVRKTLTCYRIRVS
jgi:hypothetical protein